MLNETYALPSAAKQIDAPDPTAGSAVSVGVAEMVPHCLLPDVSVAGGQ